MTLLLLSSLFGNARSAYSFSRGNTRHLALRTMCCSRGTFHVMNGPKLSQQQEDRKVRMVSLPLVIKRICRCLGPSKSERATALLFWLTYR